jgi:hypothetical protein
MGNARCRASKSIHFSLPWINGRLEFGMDKGKYCLVHQPSGIEIWVRHGFWFYGLCGVGKAGRLSLWQKLQFRRAYRRWLLNSCPTVESVNKQLTAAFLPSPVASDGHRPS